MITVNVGPSLTRVSGVGALQLQDVLQAAPEPPSDQWPAGSLRTCGANLIYLRRWAETNEPPQGTAPEPFQWFDPDRRLLDAETMARIGRQRNVQPGDYEADFPFKTTPRDYQMKIFAAARLMTKIALAPVVMGSGKTKMILDIAADKFLRDEIDCMIVIAAPKGVHAQWIREGVPTHLSDAVPRECHVWSSTRKVPVPMMEPDPRMPRKLRILTFSTSAFSGDSGKAIRDALTFAQSGRCMIVIDESSRIKNPRAIRTKTILKLRPHGAVRVIDTGTPITKGIEDLYTQYAFLDPDIIGMSNYFTFRARYCVLQPIPRAPVGAMRIVGYRNVEEFIDKIAPYTFVVPKDALGLPEKVYEEWRVELSPEQARIYKMMKEQLVDDLREGRIMSSLNAAARISYLQQVVSGRYYEEVREEVNGEEVVRRVLHKLENPRLDDLIERLNDYDGQAVIVCRYIEDVRDVQRALENLGYSVVTYIGETSDADRVHNKEAFMSGEARYIVGNETMSMGLDGLQVASLMVFYSHTFNAETRWQIEDRIHRLGMLGTALYADMIAPGTVDGLFVKNRARKLDIVATVAEHPDMLNNAEETMQ